MRLIVKSRVAGIVLACACSYANGQEDKALQLFQAAIEAMGGDTYLAVRDISSEGHFFVFNREGANSNRIKFNDYTKLPDKSRYEAGNNKKARDITVFDLTKNEGWIVEGQKPLRQATAEEMKSFQDAVKHSIETIFRFRYRNPENQLFYLGPGQGAEVRYEIVKLLDPDNDEVTVYFDRSSKLPAKIQFITLDKQGVKERNLMEFYQWHTIEGVETPLRMDLYINGRRAQQVFVFQVTYNTNLDDVFFSKPIPPK